ncbi:MAG: hypothetical protein LUF33_08790 [Clostridiales bacterium]|nr:hypothetical protein [Clostridiales bacterium]
MPAILIIIFFISDFSIYIIPKYIPYDNIFDISYYITAIAENSNLANSLALTGDTYLVNLYSNSFNLLVWLIIIFALIFTVTVIYIKNVIKKLYLTRKGVI